MLIDIAPDCPGAFHSRTGKDWHTPTRVLPVSVVYRRVRGERRVFEGELNCRVGIHIGNPGGDEGAAPREKGLDHLVAVGKGVLVAAPFQVFMDRHEGGETEPGVGDSQDKGMGLGRRLAVSDGYGPLEAKFTGQPGDPDNGYFAGIFAEEGIDATSETAESSHVGGHLVEFS